MNRKFFPAPRWAVLAGLAGACAGMGAVYFGLPGSGNGGDASDAAPAKLVAATESDQACALKADEAKRIGTAARGEVAAMLSAKPPVSLAGLQFVDPQGKPMTLADKKGRTLLVNLWATWCAPCRAEMPALDALETEMGGERFEVVTVNLDKGDASKPDAFLDEIGVKALERYRDPSLKLFETMKRRGLVLGLPATFLVDTESCVLGVMNGSANWRSADAKALVEAALEL
ncbi:MAG: TlpA family protein disulfide reductase [Methylobacterium mesophilicum]|nr:TlpA family protein disulfide reductase [Methylobacterium mesophilicum]